MQLEDYKTLSCLKPLDQIRDWSEGDVPLEKRGVSLDWLIRFMRDLQAETQIPRTLALREAEQASYHNKAADWGLHEQPYLPVPHIPAPTLMNVHRFVEYFVKPLTENIKAPLYACIPDEHVGPPDIFISHSWNALLVGPELQAIGTMDALTEGFANPQATRVWIDFVCYNQHRFATIAPDMERVIGEIQRIGFAATPVPLLDRSWCLWELLCSERTGVSPEIFIRHGFRNDKILSVNGFFRSFCGVEHSRSTSPRDQADIFSGFLAQFGKFEAANAHIGALIHEKLSHPWFELHPRDMDLQFRPYPFIYDMGTDAAERAAGIENWKTFEPYYTPALRECVLFGSHDRVLDLLFDAGLPMPYRDRLERELEAASPLVEEAFRAAATGDAVTLKLVLAEGLDVQTRLADMDLLTAVIAAGHLATVRVILDAGADPNSSCGMTPLCIAAEKGQLDVVRLLVERGAKINAPEPDGWTPTLFAASSGHAAVLTYLLEMGADANIAAGEKMATPLHVAATYGHAHVAAILLRAGVAVSPKAFNGATPLYYAVENGHVDVATLLLDHHADTHVKTTNGIMLVELARSNGLPEDIVRRLGQAEE